MRAGGKSPCGSPSRTSNQSPMVRRNGARPTTAPQQRLGPQGSPKGKPPQSRISWKIQRSLKDSALKKPEAGEWILEPSKADIGLSSALEKVDLLYNAENALLHDLQDHTRIVADAIEHFENPDAGEPLAAGMVKDDGTELTRAEVLQILDDAEVRSHDWCFLDIKPPISGVDEFRAHVEAGHPYGKEIHDDPDEQYQENLENHNYKNNEQSGRWTGQKQEWSTQIDELMTTLAENYAVGKILVGDITMKKLESVIGLMRPNSMMSLAKSSSVYLLRDRLATLEAKMSMGHGILKTCLTHLNSMNTELGSLQQNVVDLQTKIQSMEKQLLEKDAVNRKAQAASLEASLVSSFPYHADTVVHPEKQPQPSGKSTIVHAAVWNSQDEFRGIFRGDEALMQESLHLFNKCSRVLMAKYDGYELYSYGDMVVLAFPEVIKALKYAVDLQRLLLSAPWPKELLQHPLAATQVNSKNNIIIWRGLRVNMSVHYGEALATILTGDELNFASYGMTLDVARGVFETAQPGELVITADAHEKVCEETNSEFMYECDALVGETETRYAPYIMSDMEVYRITPRELQERKFTQGPEPSNEITAICEIQGYRNLMLTPSLTTWMSERKFHIANSCKILESYPKDLDSIHVDEWSPPTGPGVACVMIDIQDMLPLWKFSVETAQRVLKQIRTLVVHGAQQFRGRMFDARMDLHCVMFANSASAARFSVWLQQQMLEEDWKLGAEIVEAITTFNQSFHWHDEEVVVIWNGPRARVSIVTGSSTSNCFVQKDGDGLFIGYGGSMIESSHSLHQYVAGGEILIDSSVRDGLHADMIFSKDLVMDERYYRSGPQTPHSFGRSMEGGFDMDGDAMDGLSFSMDDQVETAYRLLPYTLQWRTDDLKDWFQGVSNAQLGSSELVDHLSDLSKQIKAIDVAMDHGIEYMAVMAPQRVPAEGISIPPEPDGGSYKVVILTVDVEDSIDLWGQHADIMPEVMAMYLNTVRSVISEEFGAVEMRVQGCLFQFVFGELTDAVKAALTLHKVVLSLDWHPDILSSEICPIERDGNGKPTYRGPRVKCAVGSGYVQMELLNGVLLFSGIVVDQASILCNYAHGGDVLVSESCHQELMHSLSTLHVAGPIIPVPVGQVPIPGFMKPTALYNYVCDLWVERAVTRIPQDERGSVWFWWREHEIARIAAMPTEEEPHTPTDGLPPDSPRTRQVALQCDIMKAKNPKSHFLRLAKRPIAEELEDFRMMKLHVRTSRSLGVVANMLGAMSFQLKRQMDFWVESMKETDRPKTYFLEPLMQAATERLDIHIKQVALIKDCVVGLVDKSFGNEDTRWSMEKLMETPLPIDLAFSLARGAPNLDPMGFVEMLNEIQQRLDHPLSRSPTSLLGVETPRPLPQVSTVLDLKYDIIPPTPSAGDVKPTKSDFEKAKEKSEATQKTDDIEDHPTHTEDFTSPEQSETESVSREATKQSWARSERRRRSIKSFSFDPPNPKVEQMAQDAISVLESGNDGYVLGPDNEDNVKMLQRLVKHLMNGLSRARGQETKLTRKLRNTRQELKTFRVARISKDFDSKFPQLIGEVRNNYLADTIKKKMVSLWYTAADAVTTAELHEQALMAIHDRDANLSLRRIGTNKRLSKELIYSNSNSRHSSVASVPTAPLELPNAFKMKRRAQKVQIMLRLKNAAKNAAKDKKRSNIDEGAQINDEGSDADSFSSLSDDSDTPDFSTGLPEIAYGVDDEIDHQLGDDVAKLRQPEPQKKRARSLNALVKRKPRSGLRRASTGTPYIRFQSPELQKQRPSSAQRSESVSPPSSRTKSLGPHGSEVVTKLPTPRVILEYEARKSSEARKSFTFGRKPSINSDRQSTRSDSGPATKFGSQGPEQLAALRSELGFFMSRISSLVPKNLPPKVGMQERMEGIRKQAQTWLDERNSMKNVNETLTQQVQRLEEYICGIFPDVDTSALSELTQDALQKVIEEKRFWTTLEKATDAKLPGSRKESHASSAHGVKQWEMVPLPLEGLDRVNPNEENLSKPDSPSSGWEAFRGQQSQGPQDGTATGENSARGPVKSASSAGADSARESVQSASGAGLISARESLKSSVAAGTDSAPVSGRKGSSSVPGSMKGSMARIGSFRSKGSMRPSFEGSSSVPGSMKGSMARIGSFRSKGSMRASFEGIPSARSSPFEAMPYLSLLLELQDKEMGQHGELVNQGPTSARSTMSKASSSPLGSIKPRTVQSKSITSVVSGRSQDSAPNAHRSNSIRSSEVGSMRSRQPSPRTGDSTQSGSRRKGSVSPSNMPSSFSEPFAGLPNVSFVDAESTLISEKSSVASECSDGEGESIASSQAKPMGKDPWPKDPWLRLAKALFRKGMFQSRYFLGDSVPVLTMGSFTQRSDSDASPKDKAQAQEKEQEEAQEQVQEEVQEQVQEQAQEQRHKDVTRSGSFRSPGSQLNARKSLDWCDLQSPTKGDTYQDGIVWAHTIMANFMEAAGGYMASILDGDSAIRAMEEGIVHPLDEEAALKHWIRTVLNNCSGNQAKRLVDLEFPSVQLRESCKGVIDDIHSGLQPQALRQSFLASLGRFYTYIAAMMRHAQHELSELPQSIKQEAKEAPQQGLKRLKKDPLMRSDMLLHRASIDSLLPPSYGHYFAPPSINDDAVALQAWAQIQLSMSQIERMHRLMQSISTDTKGGAMRKQQMASEMVGLYRQIEETHKILQSSDRSLPQVNKRPNTAGGRPGSAKKALPKRPGSAPGAPGMGQILQRANTAALKPSHSWQDPEGDFNDGSFSPRHRPDPPTRTPRDGPRLEGFPYGMPPEAVEHIPEETTYTSAMDLTQLGNALVDIYNLLESDIASISTPLHVSSQGLGHSQELKSSKKPKSKPRFTMAHARQLARPKSAPQELPSGRSPGGARRRTKEGISIMDLPKDIETTPPNEFLPNPLSLASMRHKLGIQASTTGADELDGSGESRGGSPGGSPKRSRSPSPNEGRLTPSQSMGSVLSAGTQNMAVSLQTDPGIGPNQYDELDDMLEASTASAPVGAIKSPSQEQLKSTTLPATGALRRTDWGLGILRTSQKLPQTLAQSNRKVVRLKS